MKKLILLALTLSSTANAESWPSHLNHISGAQVYTGVCSPVNNGLNFSKPFVLKAYVSKTTTPYNYNNIGQYSISKISFVIPKGVYLSSSAIVKTAYAAYKSHAPKAYPAVKYTRYAESIPAQTVFTSSSAYRQHMFFGTYLSNAPTTIVSSALSNTDYFKNVTAKNHLSYDGFIIYGNKLNDELTIIKDPVLINGVSYNRVYQFRCK